jgi:predicted nucleic acid-binding protein
VVLLSEESNYWSNLQRVLLQSAAIGPLVHDARIAALCQLHGVDRLWTLDRDFGRFRDLKTVNPLR